MGKSSLWARVGRDKKKGRNRRTERKREGGRGEGEQGRGEERKEMWKEGDVEGRKGRDGEQSRTLSCISSVYSYSSPPNLFPPFLNNT